MQHDEMSNLTRKHSIHSFEQTYLDDATFDYHVFKARKLYKRALSLIHQSESPELKANHEEILKRLSIHVFQCKKIDQHDTRITLLEKWLKSATGDVRQNNMKVV